MKDWEETLGDLAARRAASRAMGGDERLAKHRAAGKLDARARIAHLLDAGSFQELGTLVGGPELPADAVVIGSGRVDGRPVVESEMLPLLVEAGFLAGPRRAVLRP
jgi:acetyl-CoA carboxylase carboxyltransferase component